MTALKSVQFLRENILLLNLDVFVLACYIFTVGHSGC